MPGPARTGASADQTAEPRMLGIAKVCEIGSSVLEGPRRRSEDLGAALADSSC
jgi:hypothetical protein